jgi:hypothetical protein
LHDNMKLKLTLVMVACAGLVSARTDAQILKPIDPTTQADINGKNVSFGNVQFGTISQPTRELPESTTAKGDLKLRDVDWKDKNVDVKSLDMSTVSIPVLAKANFRAKRAAVDKVNDEGKKQVGQTKQIAPITARQIRPFTPGGEAELKKQLNEPH